MTPKETLALAREIVAEGPSFGQLNPLAQEVIRLTAALDEADNTGDLLVVESERVFAERTALIQRSETAEAEHDAALKALEKIASYKSGGLIEPGTPNADRHEMLHIAREALKKIR